LISVRFEADGLTSLEQLMEQGTRQAPPEVAINPKQDVFSILYTSGTTGRPKGAMLTHDNVVHTGVISAEMMNCTPEDVFLVAVPVFHVFGLVPSIVTTIAAGARMVLMEQFKADLSLALIEQERVTVKHGVPTMFILELNHPQFKRFTLSSLRTGIVAAAACPVEIVRRIRTEMGCDIVICYGLSETSATLTATDYSDDDLVRSETCGKALPGAEVKIVDANRQQLPPGEVGEVVCRGFGVMKGYYNLPEETRQALDEDGWFYTGDLGTLDDKGYLRIVGRKKEMIIRGGYNIYPREVEEVFYTHPGVMEIAIVGLPDTVLGEISCAAIKLKPGKTATEEEMKSFIKQRVANYKVPDKIVFVDEFPMTASGKIKKVEMQVQLKERLGAELR
jgi:fatty-acyl-CoA synthase